ncbi:MAG: hypothetical protein AAFY28_21335, partial [Actinomycetota bacterium]
MTAVEPQQLALPGFDEAKERWAQAYDAGVADPRAVRNRSGIEIKPLYGPDDWDGSGYVDRLGFPG